MFLNELNDEMNIQRGSEMNESLRYYLENFEIRDMYCEAYGICESDYEDDDDDDDEDEYDDEDEKECKKKGKKCKKEKDDDDDDDDEDEYDEDEYDDEDEKECKKKGKKCKKGKDDDDDEYDEDDIDNGADPEDMGVSKKDAMMEESISIDTSEQNKTQMMRMMAWMQGCGEIGHSPQYFKVGVDGDGSGRINFKFDNEEDENMFKKIKSEMMSDYNKNKKDFEKFDFE